MEAPTCRVCGKGEWRHVCGGLGLVVNKIDVVVNKRSGDRHRKDRKVYMREYMRKRRAEARLK